MTISRFSGCLLVMGKPSGHMWLKTLLKIDRQHNVQAKRVRLAITRFQLGLGE